ncbi:exonuclease SbcC [Aquipluma nitroreducens]|uniref:Exonuclease SbcC n=1 Tax=Aquipluma nitroreducens TaxID=2010828 RepID=A0A5K7S6M3_9BACT|nr:AAA family ATPase [Aquipluma nitroreducens]BBE17176.1 exonuclease SbcC [Aquipluma nitroreducens]
MIPVKLTIQGLYSYQEKQTIDFTRLTEANLFGIFGSVGSGKSSILEAITFAIYGKTDRLNLSGDNRNYNMMNLKSNDLLIEFVFETGKDQTAYQAVVKGRRNGKKFEEVKTLERSAYRNDGGNWIPIEPEQLEKVIGLSYDNFKRTIIIPQGQFQEFLQLGNKDRTQMMKELFNLEKFELYYNVVSLENINNSQKENLDGQLKQLGAIDPEQIKLYEVQLTQLRAEIGQLQKSLTDQQKQELEWKRLQETTRKLEDIQHKLKQLKDREPEFVALEKTILNYEQCLIQFKNQLDALAQSDKKIIQKTELIERETISLKKSEEEIARSERDFTVLKEAYDRRDLLKQQAEELVKVARLNILQTVVLTDQERIAKGELILAKTVESLEKLKREKETLELLLKTEKAKLPDLAMLSQVKIWHNENKNLNRQLSENKAEVDKFQKEIQSIADSVKAHFAKLIFEGLSAEADVAAGIQFLKEKMEQLKQQMAVLDLEMEHYRVQSKLEEYAVNLHDGEACPLCGSISHPAVFSAASVADALTEAQKLKAGLEKEISLANESINQLNDLGNRLKFNLDQLNGLLIKQNELDAKVANHTALFKWDAYTDEALVNQAFAAAEIVQKAVTEKERELEKVSAGLEKEVSNKEKFQAEIEKIKTSLVVAQTEIKTLSEQIRLINTADFPTKTSGEIETERQLLLQKHAAMEKQFSELTNKLTELRKTKDTDSGSLEANRKELFQEREANSAIQNELTERLEKSSYANIEEIKQILAQVINLELQKQKLADFRQQLMLLQNQFAQTQNEIGTRVYDPEAHQKLVAEIASIGESLNRKNQELGKVEQLLKKLKNDLESQVQLRKELENLELRAENIKTMKSLFKASGFVNYISSVYLQNLCNAANDRFFQLTRQKLSLEITDDNNFLIRDYLNGGKVRSVKTLSGGQTFQAALSLALALADNIQKITDSNQNFFFLDEGFGSLDKDSLAVVFDTLKSLRKENRIVGVISHVEEMQQEIDTHLRIENHEETGSRILASWE